MIPTAFVKSNLKNFIDKKFNLKSQDFMILYFLMSCSKYKQKKGKNVVRIERKKIAEFFGCPAPQISSATTRLKNAGFLEKERDQCGRLVYLISPSVFFTGPKKIKTAEIIPFVQPKKA